MIAFIHALTGQIIEIEKSMVAWFMGDVADPEHWTDMSEPVAEVAPVVVEDIAPVSVPVDAIAVDAEPVTAPEVVTQPVEVINAA